MITTEALRRIYSKEKEVSASFDGGYITKRGGIVSIYFDGSLELDDDETELCDTGWNVDGEMTCFGVVDTDDGPLGAIVSVTIDSGVFTASVTSPDDGDFYGCGTVILP